MTADVLLVMGVSGSGKSTVGAMLAGRLGWEYAEADDFHPKANVEKMHAGIPLTDDDRWPWLRSIATWIDDHIQADRPAVVTCSALKRSYRDLLMAGRSSVRLVYLDGSQELIAHRMASRHDHFFPAKLLETQFRDLEPPAPNENPLVIPITGSPTEITEEILHHL